VYVFNHNESLAAVLWIIWTTAFFIKMISSATSIIMCFGTGDIISFFCIFYSSLVLDVLGQLVQNQAFKVCQV